MRGPMVRNLSVERSSLEWIGRGKRVEGEAQDTERWVVRNTTEAFYT